MYDMSTLNTPQRYISIPVREFRSIEAEREKLTQHNKELLKMLNTKDNIIIFENEYKLTTSIFQTFFDKNRDILPRKQEDFIKKLTEEYKESFRKAKIITDKYHKIPKWVRKIFVK